MCFGRHGDGWVWIGTVREGAVRQAWFGRDGRFRYDMVR